MLVAPASPDDAVAVRHHLPGGAASDHIAFAAFAAGEIITAIIDLAAPRLVAAQRA
jgi:hypothetical protein